MRDRLRKVFKKDPLKDSKIPKDVTESNAKDTNKQSAPPSDANSQLLTMTTKPKKKKFKLALKIAGVLLIVMVVIGGVFAYRAYRSVNKVIQKNTGTQAIGLQKKEVEPAKLKGEGDGRVNVLLLGVGDSGHAGELLSDTIIVASYDPKTNDVTMLSIPRDMYVPIGTTNSYSKINNAHAFGEQAKDGGGPEMTKTTVSKFLGIPIHYFIRTDFSALKQSVDAVGGIDVVVPDTLADPEYPCERNDGSVCGFSILEGNQHLNGSAALKYVRCRKGNCGDDFGRAERQQAVLLALQTKAKQQNFLYNPSKISEFLGIVSNNVRTDIQLGEIERLSQIARKIDFDTVTTKVLGDASNNLVRATNIGGASVVVPSAGVGNHKAIQAYVRSIFVDGYIKHENAKIHVLNGTSNVAKTKLMVDMLKSYNYNVISSGPAATTTVKTTQIIDNTNGTKPYTIQYLQNRLGVTATKPTTAAPVTPGAEIEIIIGADYKTP